MARMTKQEVEAKIDAALAEGKVYNVELNDIKDALSRLVDQALEVVSQQYWDVFHGMTDENRRNTDQTFSGVRYASHYPHNIPGFMKKLPKTVSAGWQGVLDAYLQFGANWQPLCEKFIALKKVEVVKGRKPVEVKSVTSEELRALRVEKAQLQQEISSGRGSMGMLSQKRSRVRAINAILNMTDAMAFGTSPVSIAILPMKEKAMEYARERAVEYVAKLRSELAHEYWNLDRIAPKPTKDDSKIQTRMKNMIRNKYLQIVHVVEQSPTIVTFNQDGADRVIKFAVEQAAFVFDKFVTKMDHKIGDHDSAEVDGTPWIQCVVSITKGKVIERWHTQQIINYSIYGKAYNQWPTRLMK